MSPEVLIGVALLFALLASYAIWSRQAIPRSLARISPGTRQYPNSLTDLDQVGWLLPQEVLRSNS